MVGDVAFLDSSRVRWLLGKFKSKQRGPYLITQVFPNGAFELKAKEGVWFKVNREQIKLYFGHKGAGNEVIEGYHLDEV